MSQEHGNYFTCVQCWIESLVMFCCVAVCGYLNERFSFSEYYSRKVLMRWITDCTQKRSINWNGSRSTLKKVQRSKVSQNLEQGLQISISVLKYFSPAQIPVYCSFTWARHLWLLLIWNTVSIFTTSSGTGLPYCVTFVETYHLVWKWYSWKLCQYFSGVSCRGDKPNHSCRWCRQALCPSESICSGKYNITLHCTALDYTTLHYTTLHCTTLHLPCTMCILLNILAWSSRARYVTSHALLLGVLRWAKIQMTNNKDDPAVLHAKMLKKLFILQPFQ